jgi:hypothetical protein
VADSSFKVGGRQDSRLEKSSQELEISDSRRGEGKNKKGTNGSMSRTSDVDELGLGVVVNEELGMSVLDKNEDKEGTSITVLQSSFAYVSGSTPPQLRGIPYTPYRPLTEFADAKGTYDEDQTRARSEMTQESLLDVIMRKLLLEKAVRPQKDHRSRHPVRTTPHRTSPKTDKQTTNQKPKSAPSSQTFLCSLPSFPIPSTTGRGLYGWEKETYARW